MSTRSLLINFNDCPPSIDSLLPDNGLANLAGSLLKAGHKTKIMDYCTIETVRDYRPPSVQRKLKWTFLRYKVEIFLFGKLSKTTYKRFRHVEKKISLCRQEKIKSVIKELSQKIKERNIDFIGFKLWSGESFLGSIKIATTLKKKFPDLLVFAGGPHVEVFDKHILEYTDAFDVLCVGEGEEVILQLAEYAEGKRSLQEVDSIFYKKDDKITSNEIKLIDNLNALAEPVYDPEVYPAMEGNQKIKLIMLEESRGCPYRCNFCIHKIKSGNKWRKREVGNVINSIRKISNQVNSRVFRFSGSNTPYFFREKLAKALIKEKTNIKYVGFADTRQPEKEDYELLKKSGCISLCFGIETADPFLLDTMINKQSTLQWAEESLVAAKEAGILTAASLIVPCPGQRKDSTKKTIELMLKTRPDGVSISPGAPYPKTRWFKESKKFGFDLPSDVEKKMMTYTIKYTMPPALMAPFPFKMDGKDFYKIVDEMIDVAKKLEKRGIPASLNDSQLMIAYILGLQPKQIEDINQKGMGLGQYKKLKKIISDFNQRVKLNYPKASA